jgi:hypothetical protein
MANGIDSPSHLMRVFVHVCEWDWLASLNFYQFPLGAEVDPCGVNGMAVCRKGIPISGDLAGMDGSMTFEVKPISPPLVLLATNTFLVSLNCGD